MGEEPERLREIRYLCEQWMSVSSLPANAIPASPDDVLWLLAEVERLAAERYEWKNFADSEYSRAQGFRTECERLAGRVAALDRALRQTLDCKGPYQRTVSEIGGAPAICNKCEADCIAALADVGGSE